MDFTWQEAESLAVEHMRALGFSDSQHTIGGADGGVDAISANHRVAAQVKNYAAPVGRPDVQRLAGAAHDYAERLFYARSGYSQAAREYANAVRIALFTYDTNGKVTPISTRADELDEKHKSRTRSNRVMSQHAELQRAQHLRENTSPSNWDYERFTEYPIAARRHRSIVEMWPEFDAQLRARGDDAVRGEAEQSITQAMALFHEQVAAELVIPRVWSNELTRLERYRATIFKLEVRLARALPNIDVRGLLDLAAFDRTSKSEMASGRPNRPVTPLPTQADWDSLWWKRATTLVRVEALRTTLAELDRRGRFKPQWTVRSPRFTGALGEIPPLLERRSYWVGPDHFSVRSGDIAVGAERTAELEAQIGDGLRSMPKQRDRIDVVPIVNAHGDAWALNNGDRDDIRPLLDAGFSSQPL